MVVDTGLMSGVGVQKENSSLTTHLSKSTYIIVVIIGEPALRHGSLNSLNQTALHLPS